MKLDAITSETVADFASHRRAAGMQVSTVNSSLQVLRRILRLAVEWGALESAPIVKMLPGARQRERVVTAQEEARYLAAAPERLAAVAAVLVDTGLRPEECFRLRWESITWTNGRFGTLLVTHGKTAAARRVLPMTPRVRRILEGRWSSADKPEEGWVWTALTRSGHVEPSSFRKQHAATFETIAKEAKINNVKPVRAFVLYSLRHTFLTRLGESGCDAWTLARIAGHSNISMSSRYVHPSEDAVLDAMARLGGHKIGHSENETPQLPVAKDETSAVN
jgi:integrase